MIVRDEDILAPSFPATENTPIMMVKPTMTYFKNLKMNQFERMIDHKNLFDSLKHTI